MTPYADIIDITHWQPRRHNRMPSAARAAQFAPFAALEGFDDSIDEVHRPTHQPIDLDDDRARALDRRIAHLRDISHQRPQVTVTYFRPDSRKAGGSYVTYSGRVRRVEVCEGLLLFEGGIVVPLRSIHAIIPVSS